MSNMRRLLTFPVLQVLTGPIPSELGLLTSSTGWFLEQNVSRIEEDIRGEHLCKFAKLTAAFPATEIDWDNSYWNRAAARSESGLGDAKHLGNTPVGRRARGTLLLATSLPRLQCRPLRMWVRLLARHWHFGLYFVDIRANKRVSQRLALRRSHGSLQPKAKMCFIC